MKPFCSLQTKYVAAGLFAALLITGAVPAMGAEVPPQTTAPEKASFCVTNEYKIQLPKGAKRVRVWFAVPQEDAESVIRDLSVSSEYPVHYYRDSWRNTVGYEEILAPQAEQITIREQFTLTRSEIRNTLDPHRTRSLTEPERKALASYLEPSTHVIINGQIKSLAASITGGETNPILAARKLYNWTLNNVDYWVKDPDHLKASEVGSTEYCLRTKTGNCTDFHSLFASLARASGIPTRMVYGSLLKPTLNGVAVDGSYHCWIQFYAPGYGWLPLDVSLANIYGKEFPLTEKNKKLVDLTTATGYHGLDRGKIDYYFGNLDDRRVVWSEERDLMLQPPQDNGPVNALTKMYVEIDGKPSADWTRQFTYKEVHPEKLASK
jgi:transglutaminase-like putative cysteine protease